MNTGDNRQDISAGPDKVTCIILGFVTLVILGLAIYSLVASVKSDAIEPPRILIEFLDDMTSMNTAEFHKVMPSYFDENDEEELQKIQGQFEEVFAYFLPKVAGYKVVASYPGYLEVTLLDESGTSIYPSIAFIYKLDKSETLIRDFTIARLQPFSRYDEEYNEAWN